MTIREFKISEEAAKLVRRDILACDGKGTEPIASNEIDNVPIYVIAALADEKAVVGVEETAREVPFESLPKLKPRSFFSVAFFLGEGSCFGGMSIGTRSRWWDCDRA